MNKWDWSRVPKEADEILTDRQAQFLDLLRNGYSLREAGKATGTTYDNAKAFSQKIKAKLRKHDCSAESNYSVLSLPPYQADKKTAHYKRNPETGDLELNQIWVKPKVEADKINAIKEFIEGMKDEIPRIPRKPLPKGVKWDSDLLSAIVIGDAHVGMYAYGVETKQRDFDTNIASMEIMTAVDDLVERSPNAETGMLVNVGDFLHSDTSRGETWSGTRLDHDTRRKLVIKTARETVRYCIDRMLEKFKRVIVVNARGNHDDNSAWALSEIIEVAYEKEPRVEVLPTEGYFHYVEFGKWLLAIHHGDKVKAPKLVSSLARDFPEVWGRTSHRMWMVGHIHHQSAIEIDGCIVRSFGTLAPRDSWHTSMGYGSESAMELLTFKKEGGMHSTLIYNIPNLPNEADLKIA